MKNWELPEVRVESWKPASHATAPIAVELCCGMGGIGIGLRSLGIRVAKAYDSWGTAVAVYNHNAPEAVAVQCDLLTREGYSRIVTECRSLGEVDLLAAGPPCKGFSQMINGRHDRENPHNEVLKAIPDYIASLKPRLVLIENVPGLIRHAGGRTFRDLLKRLQTPGPPRLHYRVEYQVYDASLYGTPQSRRRIILLAVRDGDEHLPPPGPDLTPLYSALRYGREVPKELQPYASVLRDEWDARIVSARQALSDLPKLGPGADEKQRPYCSAPLTAYQRIMRQDAPDLLSNTRTPNILAETVERLRHIPVGGYALSIPKQHLNGLSRRFSSAYRRLHPDVPSTTLSTRSDCAYHYAFMRSLSVREYARIQGIPDYFTIPETLASRKSAYEMIGNSVPPLLVRAVLSQPLEHG